LVVVASSLSGCAAPADLYQRLQDEDPKVRAAAAVQAGKLKDRAALPYLVDRLDDPEEEVRFVAYLALRNITGQTMGWNYADPPERRAEAVARWRAWLGEYNAARDSSGDDGAGR